MTYKDWLRKHNIHDPDNPLHYYDYEAAFKAGATRDADGHWPSKHKHKLHPNRYVMQGGKLIDSITGKEATEEEKEVNETMRMMFEKGLEFDE